MFYNTIVSTIISCVGTDGLSVNVAVSNLVVTTAVVPDTFVGGSTTNSTSAVTISYTVTAQSPSPMILSQEVVNSTTDGLWNTYMHQYAYSYDEVPLENAVTVAAVTSDLTVTTSSDGSNNSNAKTSTGMIAIIVIVVAVGLLAMVVFGYSHLRRHKTFFRRSSARLDFGLYANEDPTTGSTPSETAESHEAVNPLASVLLDDFSIAEEHFRPSTSTD